MLYLRTYFYSQDVPLSRPRQKFFFFYFQGLSAILGQETPKGMRTFEFKTHAKEELVDITSVVRAEVESRGIASGICVVYAPHTTAGLIINENADPDVRKDILMALRSIVPDSLPYLHTEGNSPGHVKASITGASVTVMIENGRLMLGVWQGIFFCEFDGPRQRKVYIKITPA